MNRYEHGGRIYDKEITLDYSANINPFGMPEGVKRAICDGISSYHLYPDDDTLALRRAIAKAENVKEDWIICGNGASDLIYRLCYSLKPKKACVLAPTFSEYEKALRSVGSEVVYLSLEEENGFCLETSSLNQLTADLDLLFLCNPNNPVGNVISGKEMERILEICEKLNIFLVIDECFLDFIEEHEQLSANKYLQNEKYSKRIFLLKAFTKLYGMAGMRLGYGISSCAELLEAMKFHGAAWNVSTPAQLAGIAALQEDEYVKKTRILIAQEREYLMEQLRKVGVEPFPSKVNYIMFKGPEGLAQFCMQKGILIRSCDNYIGLSRQYYRIAVRFREENEVLIKCFEEFQNL